VLAVARRDHLARVATTCSNEVRLGTLGAVVDLRPRVGRPGRQCQRQRRAERQPPRIVDLVVYPGETINRAPSPSQLACASLCSETNVVANSSDLKVVRLRRMAQDV
jgi:hypothetical protein